MIIYTTADGKAFTAADGSLLVLDAGLSLITDRTAADVLRWQSLRDKGWAAMSEDERAEWAGAQMKGAYGVSDLNRVGEALNAARDRLTAAGYLSGSEFAARVDWTQGEIPEAAYLSYYLVAVSVIREAMARFRTTPATPADVGSLDYRDANAIEQILVDVDQLITNMLAARHYYGDLYSGEV